MIVVRAEEGDVEVTGAPGYRGDQVDTRGKVRLGVEAGHLATSCLVSPALRTGGQRDVNTGLQHQQHLRRDRNLNPSHNYRARTWDINRISYGRSKVSLQPTPYTKAEFIHLSFISRLKIK